MTPWTVACQAPLSKGFSRQEYWSGLPFSSPGDLPDSGIEPGSPILQADSLPTEPPGKTLLLVPWCVYIYIYYTGIQLINNVVLVSGGQQSNSVIHKHVIQTQH